MDGFEHRLLVALTQVDAERPDTAAAGPAVGRRHRRIPAVRLAAAAAAALAVGAVVVASLAGTPKSQPPGGTVTGPAPAIQQAAFAVQVNADGTVTFTASDLVDTAAATAALNAAGISGRVVNNTNGCEGVGPGVLIGWRPRPSDPSSPPAGFITGDASVAIRSSDYEPGGGILVVVQLRQRPTGPWAAVGSWAYEDVSQIPTCVDVTDPGTD
jgi:hypothetical protein